MIERASEAGVPEDDVDVELLARSSALYLPGSRARARVLWRCGPRRTSARGVVGGRTLAAVAGLAFTPCAALSLVSLTPAALARFCGGPAAGTGGFDGAE